MPTTYQPPPETQYTTTCAECNKTCWRVKGHAIYGHSSHNKNKWYWRCECEAYVGSYPGTDKPYGTAAGPALRKKRQTTHIYFDLLWEYKARTQNTPKETARTLAYKWLTKQMNQTETLHIAQMNHQQCEQAIQILKPHYLKLRNKLDQETKP